MATDTQDQPTEKVRKPRDTSIPTVTGLETAAGMPAGDGKANPYTQYVEQSWAQDAPADSKDPENEGGVLSFVTDNNERAITLLRTAANGLGLSVKVREHDGKVYFQARTKRERKTTDK